MSKGLSSVKTLTAKEIAKKWNLSLAVVSKKIAAGVKVEKEHTKSTRQANEIARDHLGERPDYYDKLGQMEKKKVKIKENTTLTGAIAGLGFNTGVPAVDSDNEYVTTNSLSNDALNGAIMDFVNRHHQHFHDKSGFKHYDAKKLKMSSNKDLAESLGSDYGTTAVPVVGDLTGSSRKVAKIDEVSLKKITDKISPNVKKKIKNVAAATALASNALAGATSFQNASIGQGSPVSDAASAAAGLPGKVGYTFFAGKSAKSGFDMAKEHIRSKQKKTERPTNEGKSIVPAQSVERGIYEISAELVGKVSNARFWQGKAPSETLTRAINKKFIESGKPIPKKDKKENAKEAWTPFFPPHHKHSARLSKEKSNKPDVIMDPGAGGTTKTIYEVKQMDTKNLINEALDDILENDLVSMKENLMTALQEKAIEKLEERKKIIASEYFAQ